MYKVFINDRAIVLTDNYEDYSSQYDTIFIKFGSEDAFFELIELLRTVQVVRKIVVMCDDVEHAWKIFKDKFVNIEAAGGVIQNHDRVLFILKNNHWDLPKGKMEGKESPENTALREVKEECGIKELSVVKELGPTYYLYRENDSTVLKKTNWFLMTTKEEGPFKGDAKEGITEVKWMDKGLWEKSKNKSFRSVASLILPIFGS